MSKLTGKDYTDHLETERMILYNSLRCMVALLETMALNGGVPGIYREGMSKALDMSWTAIDWIDDWAAKERAA